MLSYLSNTMSFLRVGAFVLVHAGMMMAVFAIGNMFHAFGFTVAVIIGNALVMVMEALLVAIQVMRLEFYEMVQPVLQRATAGRLGPCPWPRIRNPGNDPGFRHKTCMSTKGGTIMNPFLFLIPVTLLALSVAVSIILVKKGKTPAALWPSTSCPMP